MRPAVSMGISRAVHRRGLLDEVFVGIAPVLLGGGVRLFDRPDGAAVKLERIASAGTPGSTSQLLRVVR